MTLELSLATGNRSIETFGEIGWHDDCLKDPRPDRRLPVTPRAGNRVCQFGPTQSLHAQLPHAVILAVADVDVAH
jgi:hypothetical protein